MSRRRKKAVWCVQRQFSATEQDWDQLVPSLPGVYVVRKASLIKRVGGNDLAGILYIGTSGNLWSRLWAFWDGYSHTAGIFLYGNPDIASVLLGKPCKTEDDVANAIGDLTFSTLLAETRTQSCNAERSLLGAYVRKFGEVPPLNFSLPGKHIGKPTESDLKWGNQAYSGLLELRKGK